MIEDIINEHKRHQDQKMHIGDRNPFTGPTSKVGIPNKHAGLVIGKNGDTLRSICQRSGAQIFIPKEQSEGEERIVEIVGDDEQIEVARQEIAFVLQHGVPGGA